MKKSHYNLQSIACVIMTRKNKIIFSDTLSFPPGKQRLIMSSVSFHFLSSTCVSPTKSCLGISLLPFLWLLSFLLSFDLASLARTLSFLVPVVFLSSSLTWPQGHCSPCPLSSWYCFFFHSSQVFAPPLHLPFSLWSSNEIEGHTQDIYQVLFRERRRTFGVLPFALIFSAVF